MPEETTKTIFVEEDPAIIQSYQDESNAFKQQKAEEFKYWKDAWQETISAPTYKANPRPAETKRKEAALKSLFAGFGTIFADKTPIQDYRADIYQTRSQADTLDQSEQAKEAASWQQRLDKLHKAWTARPKHEEDTALRLLNEYRAGINKDNTLEGNRWWRQLKQQEFNAGEKQKDRDAAKQRNADNNATRLKIKENSATIKESEIVRIPLSNNRQLILPKAIWNSAALESWINEIYQDEIFNEATRKDIKDMFAQIGQFDKMQAQQAELGHLLQKYPQFEKILERQNQSKIISSPNPATPTGLNVSRSAPANANIPPTIRRPQLQSTTIDSNGKDWANGNPYIPAVPDEDEDEIPDITD
jgi:hypothetical protein